MVGWPSHSLCATIGQQTFVVSPTGWTRQLCLPAGWTWSRRTVFYSTGAVLMSPTRLKKSHCDYNPVVHSSIQIWRQTVRHLKLRRLSFTLPLPVHHLLLQLWTEPLTNGKTSDCLVLGSLHSGDVCIISAASGEITEKHVS